MKTKSVLLFIGLAVISGAELLSMSGGGLNMTGAPGESDCSGCHSGVINSNPNGNVKVSIKGNPTEYVPNQVYEVTVTSTFPGKSSFGFALAARQEGTQFEEIGKLSADGKSGVRVLEYVTHTDTSNTGNGSKSWTFNWKAPDKASGKIILYAASVVGNMNDNNTGDFVYTTTATLNAPGSTGIRDAVNGLSMKVYPTIQQTFFWLDVVVKENNRLQVDLYNAAGQLVEKLKDEVVSAGNVNTRIHYSKPHQAGIYYIKTTLGQASAFQKVMLE